MRVTIVVEVLPVLQVLGVNVLTLVCVFDVSVCLLISRISIEIVVAFFSEISGIPIGRLWIQEQLF